MEKEPDRDLVCSPPVTMEINEWATCYNDNDTDAIKINTKLNDVVSNEELPVACAVTTSSSEREVQEVEERLPNMQALVVIMTEEMLSSNR
jgi:hypothetical protein